MLPWRPCLLSCSFLHSFFCFLQSSHFLNNFLHSILILNKWYSHLDICFQYSWAGEISLVSCWFWCSSTKKISTWGGPGTGGLFFPLSILLLASLGQHVARLCWFLSSRNQAKTHMSKNMFSSSLKRSSLFSVILPEGKIVFAWF